MKDQDNEQLNERASANVDVQETIALRAYEIYESRGCSHGCHLDDWFQAENEILSELTEQSAPHVATVSARAAVENSSSKGGHRET